MALCHLPSLFIPHNFKKPHLKSQIHRHPLHRNLTFACSAEKSRKNGKGSKASKTNEDLRRQLREFVLAVGLSENHVPSMKELSDNGRKDLANIVRRRGYKVITELLHNSLKNDSDSDKPSIGDQSSSNACSDEASEVQELIPVESNEPVSSPSDSSMVETYLVRTNGAVATDTSVQISDSSESSVSSLHLRAAKFVQTGKLEIFEDATEVISGEMPTDAGLTFSNISSDITDDTAYVDSQEVLEQQAERDLAISSQGLKGSDNDENLPSEMAGERINQAEIDHLKAMLHQKEMELLELKRQIEKEKQSLRILQGKSNGEIGNAHIIEIEKDKELRAAEESLSGLKEVQIEYWGNGETVEVAGSFNGWHNRIKMDLNPSCKPVDSPYSRNLKLWSTILWLYPGSYEIKFIVDGTWRTDPNREITTSCYFTNNVLRVDR